MILERRPIGLEEVGLLYCRRSSGMAVESSLSQAGRARLPLQMDAERPDWTVAHLFLGHRNL